MLNRLLVSTKYPPKSSIPSSSSSKPADRSDSRSKGGAKHLSLLIQSQSTSQTPVISKVSKGTNLDNITNTSNKYRKEELDKEAKKLASILSSSIKVSSLENILSFSTTSSVVKGAKKPADLSSKKSTDNTTANNSKCEVSHSKHSSISRQEYLEISLNNFNLLFVIGRGGFGKVWKIESKKTRTFFAMKEMLKARILSKRSVNSVMNERYLLSYLKHPFLVNMICAFQDRDNVYLVMDLLTGGDLRFHICKRRRFTEEQTRFVVACILVGLEYLHNNGILHRDIKPENIVLDNRGYCRVTDLGIARVWRPDNASDTSGTPGYMAPEVMCRQSHGVAVDYFALGVIAYEMMLGKRPYLGRDRKEIKEQILAKQVQIRKQDVPEGWSLDAADFVNRLIQRKPANRLGLNGPAEVKNHPWVKNFPWTKLLNKEIPPPFIPSKKEEENFEYKQLLYDDPRDPYAELDKENALLLRQDSVQGSLLHLMSTSNKMKLTLSTKISQNDKLSAFYSEENTPTGAENSMERSKSIFGDENRAKKVAVSGFVAGGLRFCSTPSEKKTQGGDSPTNSDGGEEGPSFSNKVGTIKPSRFYKEASKGKPGGADGEEDLNGMKNTNDTTAKNVEESKIDQQRVEEAFKNSGVGHKNKHIRNVVDASIHRDSSLGALDDKKKGTNVDSHPWRHLIFGPHIEAERFKKHMIVTYKGLTYATKCLKGPSDKFIQQKQISLDESPENIGKKTLVLDLDETLIHTCTTKDHPDVLLTTRDEANTEYAIPLKVRPYLHEFLKRMSKLYEIVIFTASASYYANSIIDYIDPTKKLIADILARSNCMETKNGFVIKDLRIIKNRAMKNIVLVDNLSHSFGLQIENGIPILEFIDNPHDQELKHLADYLTELAKVDDVREYNKEKLRLRELAAVPEQNLI